MYKKISLIVVCGLFLGLGLTLFPKLIAMYGGDMDYCGDLGRLEVSDEIAADEYPQLVEPEPASQGPSKLEQPVTKSHRDYNYETGEIFWFVKVNTDHRDISGGVVVIDTLTCEGDESGAGKKMGFLEDENGGILNIDPAPKSIGKNQVTNEGQKLTLQFFPSKENQTKEHVNTYISKDNGVDKTYVVENMVHVIYDGNQYSDSSKAHVDVLSSKPPKGSLKPYETYLYIDENRTPKGSPQESQEEGGQLIESKIPETPLKILFVILFLSALSLRIFKSKRFKK